MKTKTLWHGRPYPHNWEFYAQCEEGDPIELAGKPNEQVKKKAPSPKEALLQAMAACTGIDVVSTLQKMRQPLEGLIIECEASFTKTLPKVFSTCEIIYKFYGDHLKIEKVAHCVFLSFTKYCGISAMIEKSGCYLIPKIEFNEKSRDLFDPFGDFSHQFKAWIKRFKNDVPVALVTGSSRGIGAALVEELAAAGYAVIATSRSKKDFQNPNIFGSFYLDVTKLYSILYLKDFLSKHKVKINLLVHNAGVGCLKGDEENSALHSNTQQLRFAYETNVFGLIETNNALFSEMAPQAIIAVVSSAMATVARDSYLYSAYRLSKRSATQYAKQLALQCQAQNKNIAVLSFHPGSVQTQLNPKGKISVETSVKNIARLLCLDMFDEMKEKNGSFWLFNEEKNVWEAF
jgi:NAD(P)-dependent dehydrogenase (short-subunit alcohol dehydrogenase family)/uncharacterized OsmC-like protein